MNPLVTIGIPCYNSERWLSQAIESALAQTWPNCEVIVVDDGSTDRSVEIARSYGDRVRLLTAEHGGANHARNEVLRASRGAWLQFLDADDYLEPQKIAQQFAETRTGASADVIYSPVWEEKTNRGAAQRELTCVPRGADLYAQWIAWEIPQTGGCLWRKTALEAIGGWKEGQPCCQEHELYLRALKAELRFVCAPTAHAVYRIWSEETLCRKDPRLVIRIKTGLIDDLQRWMQERKLWQQEHRRIAGRVFLEMSRTLAKYDLAEAATYHREKVGRDLIALEGPAAPLSYRVAYRALGFTGAEKLSRSLR
jgi:glycosyltransferase involved in cell wall biosynthesis